MKIFQEENKIMNKAELIAAVAENAELTKKDAEKAVKAFIEVVTDERKVRKFRLLDSVPSR